MMKMKKLLSTIFLIASLTPVMAQDTMKKSENLTMTLAWVADAEEPKQHVFVINGVVAYKTLDGLKKYLKDIPKGSSLTWDPGCCRIGNEPLLGSKEEMKRFQEFCESVGIKFTLVPAG